MALLFSFPGLLVLTWSVLGSVLNLKRRCTSLESLYFPVEEVPLIVQNPAMEAFQCINERAPRVDMCFKEVETKFQYISILEPFIRKMQFFGI